MKCLYNDCGGELQRVGQITFKCLKCAYSVQIPLENQQEKGIVERLSHGEMEEERTQYIKKGYLK